MQFKRTQILNFLLSGGSTWLIALRFLEGLGEGTTFPALSGKKITLSF